MSLKVTISIKNQICTALKKSIDLKPDFWTTSTVSLHNNFYLHYFLDIVIYSFQINEFHLEMRVQKMKFDETGHSVLKINVIGLIFCLCNNNVL